MMLRVAIGVLVIGLGAALGFAFSGSSGSAGPVVAGKGLPTVTTLANAPVTIYLPPPLPTTTTTTVVKLPRQVTVNKTHVTNVTKLPKP
jgi:hypothetical protein